MLDIITEGLVCPYCGLVFLNTSVRVMARCPDCARRWKPDEDEILHARLDCEN